jgi:hypothetical protein
MSYCRFTNTLRDLDDCYEHLYDTNLSESEKRARSSLIELAITIYQETIDNHPDDYEENYEEDEDEREVY